MDIEKILSGEERGLAAHALRAALVPFAWLHRAGLAAYLLPYDAGLRKRHRLPVPVISIGNITSGGTGKTPMAALVARELQAMGKRVALLSRGHGGSHEKERGARIVSDGQGNLLLGPEVAGDEPVLLAGLLPEVPIVVGRDRRVSGRLACKEFSPDVLLLDDALQFWQLHRDLDIALLDALRPFHNGWMLPRGLLREPPSHLRRAGVIVLTRSDRVSADALAALKARVAALAPQATLLAATHAPAGWVLSDGTPLAALPPGEAAAFCGIADGAAFARTLEELGVPVKINYSFGDHHAYNKEELSALIARAGARFYLTTEKDRVKAAPLWPAEGPPLIALRIAMTLDEPERLRTALERAYGKHEQDSGRPRPR